VETFVAIVMCLLGSSAQSSCIEIYPDQPVQGFAMCDLVGQQLAASWLPDHPAYRFDHVRCRAGAPFPHQHDI
jgi:hypothetical protein